MEGHTLIERMLFCLHRFVDGVDEDPGIVIEEAIYDAMQWGWEPQEFPKAAEMAIKMFTADFRLRYEEEIEKFRSIMMELA